MSAKSEILARIRAARPDVDRTGPSGAGSPGGPPAPDGVVRTYARSRVVPEGAVAQFCERAADYRAVVERVAADAVPAAIGAALAGLGVHRVGVPGGLAGEYAAGVTAAGVTVVADPGDRPLGIDELQRLDAVLTGAAVAIAETGTVVLDGGPVCGRRALTLVPDAHVCLVRADQIVDAVPAAVARLAPAGALTWISGPSATSDIELQRVEGVHGPRRLHIIVIDDA